jgi:hypothetical protein
MEKVIFEKGQEVKCINTKALPGNEVAPPLDLETNYKINEIVLDSAGNQHLDVGLKSKYNWVKSFETSEDLPNGDTIHWCHPSRFELIK